MNNTMNTVSLLVAALLLLLGPAILVASQTQREARPVSWHQASEDDLKEVIPARAPVISERIETEGRTASGIVDSKGHIVAGVLLITAGYSANGKYSYFLIAQAPLRIADKILPTGNYLIGWTRSDSELFVTLSDAATGKVEVEVTATRNPEIKRVESFHISPPNALSVIQLGRFSFPYSLP